MTASLEPLEHDILAGGRGQAPRLHPAGERGGGVRAIPIQGYLAHNKPPPPLGPPQGPRHIPTVGFLMSEVPLFSYERGTPVGGACRRPLPSRAPCVPPGVEGLGLRV